MTGVRSYVRVPPDSTGKKVRHEPHHRVGFNNRVGSHQWQLGEKYKIVDGVNNYTVTVFRAPDADSGFLGVRFAASDEYNNVSLTTSATIEYPATGGSQVADITSDEVIHVPYVHIAGGTSPNETVDVDRFGAMNVRFAEGRPQVDAFGRLRTSSGTALGEYTFAYDTLPSDFSTNIKGNGSSSHDGNRRALKLTVPDTVPGTGKPDSADGIDEAKASSNTYHHYFPGFSQTAIMTVALGDTGANGMTREWGYFDDNNGFFFRSTSAAAGLMAVVRTNASGSVSETVIASTDFNEDKVDGLGASQMDLTLTDDNIYWMDVQWLGAGRVRFGTYYRGERIVMHEHYHEGDLADGLPNSQTGSLPLTFRQSSNATQASPRNMFVWCSAVHSEHEVNMSEIGRPKLETLTKSFDPTAIENGQDYELLGILTPVQTIAEGSGGDKNRTLYLPKYAECMAYHKDGTDARVEFEVYVDPVLGGGSRPLPINSDISTSSTWLTPVEANGPNTVESYKPENFTLSDRPKFWGGGVHNIATYVNGYARLDLSDIYTTFHEGAFKNYANNGGTTDHPVGDWSASTITAYSATGEFLKHREGYPVRFYDVTGTSASAVNYATSGKEFYIRVKSKSSAYLYEDENFNTPLDTSGGTLSGGRMKADFGLQQLFAIVVKPLQPAINKRNAESSASADITCHFNLGWSEINQ